MMSNNRGEYSSASEWLTALRNDEAWHCQLHHLQSSTTNTSVLCEEATRRIGRGETFEYWEIYQHKVEPVVTEVWGIAELSLPKLEIQTIGMLSMEWLEQHAEKKSVSSEMKKRVVKKKPEKPRETMTFKRKGKVTEPHLMLLFMLLTREEWIEGNEADFKALFSGNRDENCQLIWTGKYGKGTLVGLFKRMVTEKLIEVPQGFTLSGILEGHIMDKNNQWLTGLDKGDSANDKALPVIEDCISQLKIDPKRLLNSDYDEDDDFRSEYDKYDQQDLHWHKR